MLKLTAFKNKKLAVIGLGKSGIATCVSLKTGGAEVYAYDDNEQSREKARQSGVEIEKLESLDFDIFDGLILSPGIPLTHPTPHWSVEKANDAGVPILGDVDLFFQQKLLSAPKAKTICVTGTNGKSTTTTLITHILNEGGKEALSVGNIGTPILSLETIDENIIYVIECSSYQIDLAPNIAPDIAIMQNITADHLDRHGNIENYADVKTKLLVAALNNKGKALISLDDDYCKKRAEQLNATADDGLVTISLDKDEADLTLLKEKLINNNGFILDNITSYEKLQGKHNYQNIAFASYACHLLGIKKDQLNQSLHSFGGLAHRMEIVGKADSILFVNDSKATNTDAAEKSLSTFENIFWIIGGQAKIGGIEVLSPLFSRVKKAFVIGTSPEDFTQSLEGKLDFEICIHLEKAVNQAISAAKITNAKSVILLAPAAASWDQYESFEARGEHFKQIIKQNIKFDVH